MKRILFPIVLLVTLSSLAENPLSGISFDVPKAWPCGELSRSDLKAVYRDALVSSRAISID